jgi:hypothetical protein
VTEADVLRVLDDCARDYVFPMLDNGYVYLAATRLSLHGGPTAWAIVTEVFGFSPRAGVPDLWVSTFGSRREEESAVFFPVAGGPWIDGEHVAVDADEVTLRGRAVAVPDAGSYGRHGITLEAPPRVGIWELCRYLAAIKREQVLATPEERRSLVPPDLVELLVLDEWTHPDRLNDELPSDTETFRQLATVAVTGNVDAYRPTTPPNIHWSNWPEGGTL